MKRITLPLLALLSWSVWADPVTVQVKEAPLYEKPSAISKFLGKVPYGTQLTVVATQTGWKQVKSSLGVGWLREQNVTTKKVDYQSGSQTSGASATEVSLAGRGFSEEIENDYKTKNPTLDYTDVDKMEAQGIDDPKLSGFLQDGGVVPPGGSQ